MCIERVVLNDTLFALFGADLVGSPHLNRTNFQKILFLCAAVAPLGKIEWGYDFVRASYGPFNGSIHQASDMLVLHGYAELVRLTIQKDSKLRGTYKISSRGQREVERIRRLHREKKRLDWILLVMKVLDIYGFKVVTKLAYKEPTFNEMRNMNINGTIELSADENLSVRLVENLSTELRNKYSVNIDTLTSKLILYFDYLSDDIGRGDDP